jgi:flavodoxin
MECLALPRLTVIHLHNMMSAGGAMNICIVHDSQTGNGLRLAERMQEVFQRSGAVTKLGHTLELRPEEAIQHDLDLIVVGAAVRKFTLSAPSKAWISGFAQLLKENNKTVPFGAIFVTHGLPHKVIDGYAKRLRKRMERSGRIVNAYPTWLSGRVTDVKGPFEDGTLERVEEETEQLLQWIESRGQEDRLGLA